MSKRSAISTREKGRLASIEAVFLPSSAQWCTGLCSSAYTSFSTLGGPTPSLCANPSQEPLAFNGGLSALASSQDQQGRLLSAPLNTLRSNAKSVSSGSLVVSTREFRCSTSEQHS